MVPDDLNNPPDSEDLSVRAALPRTVGASLAVNAIPDAYLLIDSPHCTFRRLAYVQGNHDYQSTLALFPGTPRVSNTEISPLEVIKNRDDEIARELTVLARHPNAGVVMVDAMAMALITAVDYGRICSLVGQQTRTPVLPVPHRTLTGDYLTAYGNVQEALAQGLPLAPKGSGHRKRIALVGYFWDRNEGDHRGNLCELHRIAGALGLEVVATWLSGVGTADLCKVQEADLIVSLPYGRKAANILAKRLGCALLRAEMPFGLAATVRFVLALGAATGNEKRAVEFIERELSEALPLLEWLVPFALLHRRIGYLGEPHLAKGIQEIAHLVGCTIPFMGFTCMPRHTRDSAPDYGSLLNDIDAPPDIRSFMALEESLPEPETVLSYPHARHLEETLATYGREQRMDALITNSFGFLTEHMGIVEFGFPSYHTHALIDRPFLGMRGFLGTLERILNALRQFEVRAAHESKAMAP